RFFEALAEERPLVLVFEDLHWADDALLDFVDYLVEWASGVPILALCTARPELLSRRPGWGGGKVNSSTTLLSPLSEQETATLVHALLGRSVIDADVQARLLEHAGGNPLYAEEFSRMLTARPGEIVLPETVQGIIAARLDTLEREEKQLLQEAAVIGRVFWLGSLGGERWRLEERLHSLERKEFVSRNRRSAVAGEDEYGFRHALVREVAYEQIPKSERAEKHRLAAEWIESLGRTEDHAEMLAHHYEAALDFARASGQNTEVLAEPARAALHGAGDRAFALNAISQAARFYERALELWPEDGRPELLLRYGRALSLVADDRGTHVLQQAAAALLAVGDREAAAEAHAFLTETLQAQGERDRAYEHIEQALALVRDTPASPAKARVLTESSRLLVIGGQAGEAIAIAREAFEMAEALGLIELAARALNNVGIGRSWLGDYPGAIADLERSIELAVSVNSPEAGRGYHNLVTPLWHVGELQRSVRAVEEGLLIVERLTNVRMSRASQSLLCWVRYFTGSWDEALEGAEAIIAECEAGAPTYFEYQPRIVRARIRLARGRSEQLVLEDIRRALDVGSAVKDPQALLQTLSHSTLVFVELGSLEQARTTAAELVELLPAGSVGTDILGASEFAWVAEMLDSADAFRGLFAAANLAAVWREPYEAVLDRDFERAAELFAALGLIDEGHARFKAGEKLLAAGRAPEADVHLRKALAFYRSLGATRYVSQTEALLIAAGLEIPA
ncbi:MAG: tetratricopeptide repeat protein, partial [Actinobacteria bacterium]|nr:tetratricopeptide repeat protein [Actinomycetota bacterium]